MLVVGVPMVRQERAIEVSLRQLKFAGTLRVKRLSKYQVLPMEHWPAVVRIRTYFKLIISLHNLFSFF